MSILDNPVIPKLYTGGYDIGQSLRFNDDDSTYLSRTPSVSGNRKTWTFRTIIKRGNLSLYQRIFSAGDLVMIGFDSTDNQLTVRNNINNPEVKISATLRDTSSWYDIQIVSDTTQATVSNRLKIYINGTLQTISVSNYPAQNFEWEFNNTVVHHIGSQSVSNSNYFDGYLAETYFIDGQALTPDYFGEFDETYGHWKPKAYEGTYGTNGFYQTYSNGANIGEDSSGNGNDFTATNLSATDIVLDSPTNNFAVLNNLNKHSATSIFAEGNLKYNSTAYRSPRATFGISSGKYYFEGVVVGVSAYDNHIGIATDNESGLDTYVGGTSAGYVYTGNSGQKYNNNVGTAYGSSFTNGDIIGVALDMDEGTLTFYKNGVSQGQAFSSLANTVFPAISTGADAWVLNFGQDSSFAGNKVAQGNTDSNGIGDFYYAPPAGYLALCTANLDTIPQPYETYVSCSTENDCFEGTYVGNGSTDGTFIYLGFLATDICIDGTHYDQTSTLFDFNANCIKCRSTTQNSNGVTYTVEAWVDVDFKYGNAQ